MWRWDGEESAAIYVGTVPRRAKKPISDRNIQGESTPSATTDRDPPGCHPRERVRSARRGEPPVGGAVPLAGPTVAHISGSRWAGRLGIIGTRLLINCAWPSKSDLQDVSCRLIKSFVILHWRDVGSLGLLCNFKLGEGLTTRASLSAIMEAIGTIVSVFAIYNQLEQCAKRLHQLKRNFRVAKQGVNLSRRRGVRLPEPFWDFCAY
jgi:hypothetical protein